MSTGKINVQAENIFPIIKKFLYSDHEIFLRELVSNAVDATTKLKTLGRLGEYTGEIGDTTIEVELNEKKKTLTVRDRGVGMTAEEVEKYLNQVAFSGAEEFLQKYKGKTEDAGIIGHFGLGFYSAFMVAKKVEVITKSWQDAPAVKWTCTGSPEYELEDAKKKDRGTEIILHIDDESKEFLEKHRIEGILNKYCKFLPVPIRFGDKDTYVDNEKGEKDEDGNVKQEKKTVPNIINNPQPAWTKKPADLEPEDYKKFYRELYPMSFEEPLFNIHINVDYPFNLTGILYFPKLQGKFDLQRNKIQLYSNQVFITDSVENIVPEFLTLLHGVIDSPDIPLNVSRSYLQSDSNVKKISAHITKKVADRLAEMFKNDRKDYESKWGDIQVFMDYGMLTDEKFFERIKPVYLLKNSAGEFFTLEEYGEKIKDSQTDKNGTKVILYTSDPEVQHMEVSAAKNKGYDVVVMNTPLTSHLVQHLEMKLEKISFKRVDADSIEKLIEKETSQESNLSEDQKKTLTPVIEKVVEKDKFTIQFESLSENDPPMVITQSEYMRRMREQSEMGGGGMMGMGKFPDFYNLVVNSNHKLISKILIETDNDKKETMARQAADLALLGRGLLKGEKLSAFIKRSAEMIAE